MPPKKSKHTYEGSAVGETFAALGKAMVIIVAVYVFAIATLMLVGWLFSIGD